METLCKFDLGEGFWTSRAAVFRSKLPRWGRGTSWGVKCSIRWKPVLSSVDAYACAFSMSRPDPLKLQPGAPRPGHAGPPHRGDGGSRIRRALSALPETDPE